MTTARALSPALRLLLALTVVLGVAYPLAVTAAARALPARADGSLIRVDDRVVGSSLLGQPVEGPGWFHARPSASDHSGETSGGSNLPASDPTQQEAVRERRAEVATREGVDPAAVPADALTASSSGLDPHISPEYAALQVPRVARERGLDIGEVERVVAEHTSGSVAGFIGTDRVDVTALNVALSRLGTR
ncbi:potassium-transporting ATPase subunit KdpC [Janibacter sp. GXQ6167]|uniref:potassium-transporting ATPase subunit KdpC n=1 Tax=Janibacter sp. GXQ6167 TaxID=3240791 RepID=UPI003523280E